MSIKIRSSPFIPDHEVLRKIGGGAYGEVWLARGVTGALRAVKVVWREDFEDARTFEREFEGILKFEPMSRDHPALVNILHVGRSPDRVSFYYYVMELGDDVSSGQDINPVEYEPKTLRADNAQAANVQWDIRDCIDVGLRLAEALDHLHERGLAHRDVKPANVIFVNGRAKLADIGLVAARGQRTFVGTEGFVPPEGPGTAQADVYSLGKVLYEIATGKDRMSFPELPDNIPDGADRKRWLELNQIICDICEPRISKRKISTASDLADALRCLQRGKRRPQRGLAAWITISILGFFGAWGAWQMVKGRDWVQSFGLRSEPTSPQVGMLRVVSAPEGAEVRDAQGQWVGTTNTGLLPVTVGDDYFFAMTKTGYRPFTLKGTVPQTVVTEPMVLFASLENFSPPQKDRKWEDHLGNSYKPLVGEHISDDFVSKDAWEQFSSEGVEFIRLQTNGRKRDVALPLAKEMDAFSEWYRQGGLKAGFLTEDYEVEALPDRSFEHPNLSKKSRQEDRKPFRMVVRPINYGEIRIITHPAGVEIYMSNLANPLNRVSVGATSEPLIISKVKPSEWQLYLVREGYKPLTIDLTVNDGEKIVKEVTLEKNLGVVFGLPWENGIGMHFVPLGEDLMVSIWETRLVDYRVFLRESKYDEPRTPYFSQTPNHPVVNVSREDAQAFCHWLTKRERKGERISSTHEYRLPTDLEWSSMVGLDEEEGISPGWRDARKQSVYPWGVTWPPDEVLGNFADASAAKVVGASPEKTIPDYDDSFEFTSPVGVFAANSKGLYDLSGNVQEWVGDEYSKLGENVLGVLRGGSWNSYQQENLYAGARNAVPPTFQDAIYGFRVVLARIHPSVDSE